MKKLISIALVALMAAGGAVSANAAVKQNKDYQILSSKITTKNNTISIYTYNMKNTGSGGGFVLDGQKSGKRYKYIFKNYLSAPKTITMPSNEKYNIWTCLSSSMGGTTNLDLRQAGGEYVKVRAKLSDINPNEFKSNGTHTQDGHTYNFTRQTVKDGYYESVLFFQSGGVFTGAVPDSNGYVEFYVSTKVDHSVNYFTEYGLEVRLCVKRLKLIHRRQQSMKPSCRKAVNDAASMPKIKSWLNRSLLIQSPFNLNRLLKRLKK